MIDCKVKAGIIGFGYMGHFHLKRSREVKGIEIVGVYDIDRGKNRRINNICYVRRNAGASGNRTYNYMYP